MGDAAVFIAPALLVAYLAVGGLLLLVSDVRKQRRSPVARVAELRSVSSALRLSQRARRIARLLS
jgi:hypothetical protein